MKISVRNFMGIERADLAAAPIALIAGENGAGKSSICRAVRAALSGETIPAGVKKSQAAMLVRDGMASATVRVEVDAENYSAVDWPAADRASVGKGPLSSPIATGEDDLLTMPADRRADALRRLLGANPKWEDFEQAARDAGLKPDWTEALFKRVSINGWDAEHESAVGKGREYKGAWAQVTGEQWGSKKAGAWTPGDWSPDLDGASVESLDAEVVAARAGLEDAIARQAIDASELERIKADADRIEAVKAAIGEAEAKLAPLDEAAKAARDAVEGMAEVDGDSGYPCPWCEKNIRITPGAADGRKYDLRKVELAGGDPAEFEKRHAALHEAKAAHQAALDARAPVAAEIEAMRADLRGCEASAAKLAGRSEGQGATVEEVERARKAADDAIKRRDAAAAKAEADKINARITLNQKVVDLLAPDGVRRAVLLRKLEAFNATLGEFSTAAGWGEVKVAADLSVTYRGRSALLLSKGERVRARVTLQVAIAKADESALLVIDDIDDAENNGRTGILKLVAHAGVPAVIAFAGVSAAKVANLTGTSHGASYWVESGICTEIPAKAA